MKTAIKNSSHLARSECFPAVERRDARVLILGSLPGQESLRQAQYYAHPRNAFWPIMGSLLGAARELPYEIRLRRLTECGVALWDVCAAACRPGSLDSNLEDEELNDFAAFLAGHPRLQLICFNGATASRIFHHRVLPGLSMKWAGIRRELLPSTSPAHAGMCFAEKLGRWQEILLPALEGKVGVATRP